MRTRIAFNPLMALSTTSSYRFLSFGNRKKLNEGFLSLELEQLNAEQHENGLFFFRGTLSGSIDFFLVSKNAQLTRLVIISA